MSFNMISQIQSQFQLGQESNGSVSYSTTAKGFFTQRDDLGRDDFYLPPSDSPSSSETNSSSESECVPRRMLAVNVPNKKFP